MRITLMLLLVLLSAGCTLNPGYDQPPLDAPKNWRIIDHDARDVAAALTSKRPAQGRCTPPPIPDADLFSGSSPKPLHEGRSGQVPIH